jgi:arylsulfatase A-like enzyme
MKVPPNVIIVLTDDQGYGDLACHGNPILNTPHLDALHAESAKLDDFHVAPVCTPTRSQLLSSQDALRNGATFVSMGRSLMNPALPTIATVFQEQGYKTGHFGKWHLGDNFPYRPQDRGFDDTVHHPAWGITSAADYFGNDYFDDTYRRNGTTESFQGYCTDVWFGEAITWMERQSTAEKPFFTYIATNAPHVPLWVPDQYRQPYLDLVDFDVASFYGMIANIDENIGRLEMFLESTGLHENTILIFMGDNGTATAEKVYNAGMRGKKASLYEGGHRVPCFVRWPSGGVGNCTITEPTQCQDIMPTLVELCELEANYNTDGVSLARRLTQAEKTLDDRMLVVQYGHTKQDTWGATTRGQATIIWGRWRLVKGELYNLGKDPAQTNNVASDNPKVVSRMQDHYDAWWADVGNNLAVYHPITVGDPREDPVRLSSCDWAGVYCDNPENIREGVMDSGLWHLDISMAGQYCITLSRWPEEARLPITAEAPIMQGVDGTLPAGISIPAARAQLIVGEVVVEAPVKTTDRSVVFTVNLRKGLTTMRTWWLNNLGERIAGAYYATVTSLAQKETGNSADTSPINGNPA